MRIGRAIWRAIITVSVVTGAIGLAAGPALAAPPAGAAATALTSSLMAATGYWVVNREGGVASAGGAPDLGGVAPSVHLDGPIVAMAATPDDEGYWLATAKGEVISFGDARAVRSAAEAASPVPVVGTAAEHNEAGYWFANSRGTTFGFGRTAATVAAHNLARGAVAIAADPAVVIPARSVAASPGGRVSAAALEAEVADAAGQTASEFALSQVGKPYIWGATGPYGYDCSGLALASWAAAGVDLPRTAAEQYYAGEHVPLRQAQPGDLIFWATEPSDPATIYHVAISLGGDRTVQAIRTGENVQVVNLWGQDVVPLATRP